MPGVQRQVAVFHEGTAGPCNGFLCKSNYTSSGNHTQAARSACAAASHPCTSNCRRKTALLASSAGEGGLFENLLQMTLEWDGHIATAPSSWHV